jgi:hypothetical protein
VQVVEDNSHRSDLIVLCGLETETAPVISGALGLSFLAHSTGEPILHGMAGGAVIVGLPDDLTQLRVSAREVLPGILNRLLGRPGQ